MLYKIGTIFLTLIFKKVKIILVIIRIIIIIG